MRHTAARLARALAAPARQPPPGGWPAAAARAASASADAVKTTEAAAAEGEGDRALAAALGPAPAPRVAATPAPLGAHPGATVATTCGDVRVLAAATLGGEGGLAAAAGRGGGRAADRRATADFRARPYASRTRRAGDGGGGALPDEAGDRALLAAALRAARPAGGAGVHVAAALAAASPLSDPFPPALVATILAAAAAGAPPLAAVGVGRACAARGGGVEAWPSDAARSAAAADAIVVVVGDRDAAIDVVAREATPGEVAAAVAAARAAARAAAPALAAAVDAAVARAPPPPPPPAQLPDPAAGAAYAAALVPRLLTALGDGAATGGELASALASAHGAASADLRRRGAWRIEHARVPGSGCVSPADADAAAPGLLAAALAARARAGAPRAGRRGPRERRELALDPAPLLGSHGSGEAVCGGTQVTAAATITVDRADGGGGGRVRAAVSRPPHAPAPGSDRTPWVGPRAPTWVADADATAWLDRALAGVLLPTAPGAPPSGVPGVPAPFGVRLAVDVWTADGGFLRPALAAASLALAGAGAPLPRSLGGGEVAVLLGTTEGGDTTSSPFWEILADPDAVEVGAAAGTAAAAATTAGVTAVRVEARAPGGLPPDATDAAVRDAVAAAAAAAADADAAAAAAAHTGASFGAIPLSKDTVGRVVGVGGANARALEEGAGVILAVVPDDSDTPPGGAAASPRDRDRDGGSLARFYAPTAEAALAFTDRLNGITGASMVAGGRYTGTVDAVADFGAFLSFPGGATGLLHISELDHARVSSVEDVVKVGDSVVVACVGRDARGLIKLSRKATLPPPEAGGSGGRAAAAPPALVATPLVPGARYTGVAKTVTDYGVFLSFPGGATALLHISEFAHARVGAMKDVVRAGESVEVECVGVDERGLARVSRKALLPAPAGGGRAGEGEERGRGGRGGGGRPPRGASGGRRGAPRERGTSSSSPRAPRAPRTPRAGGGGGKAPVAPSPPAPAADAAATPAPSSSSSWWPWKSS